jgi:hypothetical protein
MSRRPVTAVSPEGARRDASAAPALSQMLDVNPGRPKRIDQYLDYFGESSLSTRGDIPDVGEAERSGF